VQAKVRAALGQFDHHKRVPEDKPSIDVLSRTLLMHERMVDAMAAIKRS
jgi:hypothetical protein